MAGTIICNKCRNNRSKGRCCIDTYQQLGQRKGPSVVGKVFLAFVFPLLVFIGSIVVAEYLLAGFLTDGDEKTFITFLIALVITFVFMQLIRIFTRKLISAKKK